jgi:hypothetical protein
MEKIIFWHDHWEGEVPKCEKNMRYYNAYLISNRHGLTMPHCQELANIMLSSFPVLKESEVHFSIITKSTRFLNFGLARSNIFGFEPNNIPSGWELRSHLKMDFFFA